MKSFTRTEWILLIGGIVLLLAACLIAYFLILPAFLRRHPRRPHPR